MPRFNRRFAREAAEAGPCWRERKVAGEMPTVEDSAAMDGSKGHRFGFAGTVAA